MQILTLPEGERIMAKALADWENQIVEQADYIMGTSIRDPVCDIRASRRAFELAAARRMLIDLHPAITREVLSEVHQVLDRRAEHAVALH